MSRTRYGLVLFVCCLGGFFGARAAFALDTWSTWSGAQPQTARQIPPYAMIARGTGTNAYYVMEVDPTTGALTTTSTADIGRSYATSVRNAYASTNVTTGAWVQLIASTAATINCITVFDSSGQTLELGTGALASETRKLIIPPGGLGGCIPLAIPSGTRVSVRAISATASSGELDITGLN